MDPAPSGTGLPGVRRAGRGRAASAARSAGQGGGALTGDGEKDAAVVLAARRRGHCVDLVVGRERAPYGEEAGFLSWVEHNGSVLLTTAPVRRLYEEVARW